MVLQDVKLQSASEREAEQIFRTFIQDFQAPLAEIQIAIYTSLQEDIGSLTEKQKDILYAARDQSEELERVYQTFLKILENR
jgi:K+-sensing histidine kinase KdpD